MGFYFEPARCDGGRIGKWWRKVTLLARKMAALVTADTKRLGNCLVEKEKEGRDGMCPSDFGSLLGAVTGEGYG